MFHHDDSFDVESFLDQSSEMSEGVLGQACALCLEPLGSFEQSWLWDCLHGVHVKCLAPVVECRPRCFVCRMEWPIGGYISFLEQARAIGVEVPSSQECMSLTQFAEDEPMNQEPDPDDDLQVRCAFLCCPRVVAYDDGAGTTFAPVMHDRRMHPYNYVMRGEHHSGFECWTCDNKIERPILQVNRPCPECPQGIHGRRTLFIDYAAGMAGWACARNSEDGDMPVLIDPWVCAFQITHRRPRREPFAFATPPSAIEGTAIENTAIESTASENAHPLSHPAIENTAIDVDSSDEGVAGELQMLQRIADDAEVIEELVQLEVIANRASSSSST